MAKNYVTNFRDEDEPLTTYESYDSSHLGFTNHLNGLYDSNGMRKSLSLSDINALRAEIQMLQFLGEEPQYSSQVDRRAMKPPLELSSTKFMSMAERYHWQRDNPQRFRSKSSTFKLQSNDGHKCLTKPQSPMLRSKLRSRPVHYLSQKEREEMELEEIKKHKIKANPIPKSVIEGPHFPEMLKKPITVPVPFDLTEVQKKVLAPLPKEPFKARPAPKHILEKPDIPPKLPVQTSHPHNPMNKRCGSAYCVFKNPENLVEKAPKLPCQGPIRLEPFSFDKRVEEQKRRHEQWIKQQIKEEQKLANQFKAQPLPGAVKKAMHSVAAKGGSTKSAESDKENHYKFEARPPVVLHKKPFIPVHKPMQPIKPQTFALSTMKKTAEREKFDQHLKEKEKEQEKLRLQQEKEMREMQEKYQAKLRAKLVHHPKPVPSGGPFVPEKSMLPVTVPETPNYV